MRRNTPFLVVLLTSVTLTCLAPSAFAIVLSGGTVTIDLPAGASSPSFTFTNYTSQPICDVMLSTNDSDGIDPDFQGGDVVVRRPPGVTDLGWQQTPLPDDGVEDIKVFTLDPYNCIPIGANFSVGMVFDGVGSGDILRVSPTNIDMHQIQPDDLGQTGTGVYHFFNGYDGLNGSLVGSVVTMNGFPGPITGLDVSLLVLDGGVMVDQVTSSLASTYDPFTGRLVFDTPVPPGQPFDFAVVLSALLPFSSDDPDPFTTVFVEARLAELAIPTLGPLGLALLVLLLGVTGTLAARRRTAG